eukprot:m.56998 g.56998  ORF g.56998 m.56998 type:complete len:382 (-) comp6806_c0_seq2:361-1506(-)
MDFLFKSPPFSSQEKQLEEEFGLRTKAHPAPIESIIKDDSRRCCYVSRNFVLLVAAAIALLVLCHRYLGPFLDWISELNGWQGPLLLCLLFVLVSFPMAWGYIIINLGAGYIYGLFYGTLVTIVGANIGALVSFVICRRLWRDYVLEKLSTYDNLKQVVRVIEGRQGFRIIMMTRLTPVPFGLQNALFSTAKISKLRYVGATFIGLLPTQVRLQNKRRLSQPFCSFINVSIIMVFFQSRCSHRRVSHPSPAIVMLSSAAHHSHCAHVACDVASDGTQHLHGLDAAQHGGCYGGQAEQRHCPDRSGPYHRRGDVHRQYADEERGPLGVRAGAAGSAGPREVQPRDRAVAGHVHAGAAGPAGRRGNSQASNVCRDTDGGCRWG